MAKKKITFSFSFGLVKGQDGADGLNGLDGTDGIDGKDGAPGVDGIDGMSAEMRFTRTSNFNNIPYVDKNNPNPGEVWSTNMPSIVYPQVVWYIFATMDSGGQLHGQWTDPIRLTPLDNHVGPAGPVGPQGPVGEQGPQGFEGPRGHSVVFNWDGTSLGIKQTDDDEFQYQNLKGDQGVDGVAGASIRTMYTKTADESITPTYIPGNINPGAQWSPAIPSYTPPEVIWMITSTINIDNTLHSNWGNLFRLSPIDVDQDMIASMVVHAVTEQIEWEASATAEDDNQVRADVTLDLEDI